MKTIYFIRKNKPEEGKDISQKDKNTYELAENLLFEELSISCDIKKENVLDFILSRQREN